MTLAPPAQMRSIALLLSLPLVAAAASAQPPRLRAEPAHPRQGTLFTLVVEHADSSAMSVDGTLAGEPLRFERDSAGAWRALAAAPIDSAGALGAVVIVRRPAGDDTVRASVPLAAGHYPMERLRVAPQFGREPDSATAARMEVEGMRVRAVAALSHRRPRLWREPFTHPRPGRVTSGFGGGREFNGQLQSRHMGTDFAGATGTPVYAANRGVVVIVDAFFLGGNVVYVDHGAGLVTAYLHLSRQEVAVGDTVERGQEIGRVGATGRVTGPHLHLIARYGGITVDPLSLPGMKRE